MQEHYSYGSWDMMAMDDTTIDEVVMDDAAVKDAENLAFEDGQICARGLCNVGNYLSGLIPEISAVVVLFVLSGIAGYFYTALNPASSDIALEGLEGLVELIMSMTPLEIMLFIFFNNAIKSLMAFVLGLGFGLIPLLFVISNGYILGVVTYLESQENGFTYILLGIMPHGIIELPMILISAAMGLRMGINVLKALAGRYVDIKDEFKQGINVFFRFIMPMLLLAAGIETFITPVVIGLYTGTI
ncbi:stage II sporulation protein M [Methanococcoides sp. AM1]|uniref:stage II sporulation protein M n=1 Tax=Methanococcoides sp. AM1 TaxID=1201011 RepID=UPI001FCE5853|nr:stage II sporulation protein M [Methanococcoides sp. AM1]